MFLFDLQNKLKKLNSNLVIITDRCIRLHEDAPSYPLLLRFGNRTHRNSDSRGYHYISADAQKYMEMKHNGQAGEYIGGVSSPSPEHDVFDVENNTLKLKGWRSLVLHLVAKKVCTLERAKKVFNCQGLGESTWDKLSMDEKIARQAGERDA